MANCNPNLKFNEFGAYPTLYEAVLKTRYRDTDYSCINVFYILLLCNLDLVHLCGCGVVIFVVCIINVKSEVNLHNVI